MLLRGKARPEQVYSTGGLQSAPKYCIHNASIVFDLASISDTINLHIGPSTISLTSPSIDILNTRSSSQRVVLVAAASFVLESSYRIEEEEEEEEEEKKTQ